VYIILASLRPRSALGIGEDICEVMLADVARRLSRTGEGPHLHPPAAAATAPPSPPRSPASPPYSQPLSPCPRSLEQRREAEAAAAEAEVEAEVEKGGAEAEGERQSLSPEVSCAQPRPTTVPAVEAGGGPPEDVAPEGAWAKVEDDRVDGGADGALELVLKAAEAAVAAADGAATGAGWLARSRALRLVLKQPARTIMMRDNDTGPAAGPADLAGGGAPLAIASAAVVSDRCRPGGSDGAGAAADGGEGGAATTPPSATSPAPAKRRRTGGLPRDAAVRCVAKPRATRPVHRAASESLTGGRARRSYIVKRPANVRQGVALSSRKRGELARGEEVEVSDGARGRQTRLRTNGCQALAAAISGCSAAGRQS
jgi:hypothetical protein